MDSKLLKIRLVGDSSSAVRAAKKTESAYGGLGSKLLKISAAIGGASLGLGAIKKIATIGMSYDQTMNSLQAVSRATAEEMETVGNKARELGADLTLPGTSAADSTAAMLELYKGGLSLRESMDAARGAIQLASAAQVSNAEAAQIQANAISQFSLEAEDATRVADILANVSSAATGEISDVANALSYVGPVAQSVGMSIGQTGTAIGLLAKNAIIGSKGGTALRGIIASLANPSAKAAKAMKKLSVNAFDAKGNFVGMRNITKQLAKAKKKLTEEEFAAAAAAAFGREPLAAINALAKEGVKGWDDMAGAVGREGSAAEIAKAKNKGFKGAMDGLTSQLEDLALIAWGKIKGGLTKVTEGLGGLVSKVNGFIQGGGSFDFLDALNNFDGAKAGQAIKKAVMTALDTLTSMGAKIGSKIIGIIKQIDWVGLGIEAGKAVIPLVVGLATGLINSITDPAMWMSLADHWKPILLAILGIMFAPAKWVGGIAKAVAKIPFIGKMVAWILKGLNKIGGKILKGIANFFKVFVGGFRKGLGLSGPSMISRLVGWFVKMKNKIIEWGKNLAGTLVLKARAMVFKFAEWIARHGPRQAFNAFMKIKNKIVGFFKAAGKWLLKAGKAILRGLGAGIKWAFKLATAPIRLIIKMIIKLFGPAVKWLVGKGKDILRGLGNGIRNGFNWVMGKIRSLKDKVLGFFRGAGKWLWNTGKSIIQGLIDGIANMGQAVKNAVSNVLSKARNLLPFSPAKEGPFSGKGWTLYSGRAISESLADGISQRVSKVRNAARRLVDAAKPSAGFSAPSAGLSVGSAGVATYGASPIMGTTGQPIIVKVIVQGNVIGERDFAKRVTPTVREELVKIGRRNGGKIFGDGR